MDNKINLIKSDKSWIESNAVEQLEQISKLNGIVKAVGMPDLHAGKTPVGAAFIADTVIYPHIVGNDIGCGMAFFDIGIEKSKFKRERIMKKLEKLESINKIDISSFLKDDILPYDLPCKDKIGTIGSGNHFAEFQEIDQIYDTKTADSLNICKGNVYLLVHSGSRSYGEQILKKYIEEYSCQNGLIVDSDGFNAYMQDHEKALFYAKLSRELIAYRMSTAIHGRNPKKLLDSVHNGISMKLIDGKKYFIHRKGAAPSDIGCVVVAGTRGTKSYIVKPITDNLENQINTAFSISHGAGRKWARIGCKDKIEYMYMKKSISLSKLSSTLVYDDKKVLFEEAPEVYKNIDQVIEDMVCEKMITVVAALNPLVTYKV